MKNVINGKIKKVVAKVASKSFVRIADIFVALPCCGPWYEPKVPEKLKK